MWECQDEEPHVKKSVKKKKETTMFILRLTSFQPLNCIHVASKKKWYLVRRRIIPQVPNKVFNQINAIAKILIRSKVEQYICQTYIKFQIGLAIIMFQKTLVWNLWNDINNIAYFQIKLELFALIRSTKHVCNVFWVTS